MISHGIAKKKFMAHQKENVWAGAIFILLAATSYACMGLLVKFGKNIPNEQLVFVRNFVCFLVLLPWIFFPQKKPLATRMLFTHIVRALAGLLNMYCFFYSIRYIILADAMLLNNTMPLFIPLVMWVWKRERISLRLFPGLIIGFIGVLLILHPGKDIFRPAAVFALLSGIFMSISMAGIRELSKIEPVYRILFYYFAISTVVSAFPLFFALQNHTLIIWAILAGVGVFAALYQFFLTKGYTFAPAAKISPVIYFAVIISGLFDWIFWKIIPSYLSYAGILLVIVGAVYCVRVEGSPK